MKVLSHHQPNPHHQLGWTGFGWAARCVNMPTPKDQEKGNPVMSLQAPKTVNERGSPQQNTHQHMTERDLIMKLNTRKLTHSRTDLTMDAKSHTQHPPNSFTKKHI